MGLYAAYHQDRRNKLTHFFGVPMIMLSLFIPLAWLKVNVGGLNVSAALLLAAVVLLYYVFLEPIIALGTAFVTAALVLLAAWIASRGTLVGWSAFGALFVVGWILQLVGHGFEGRKPALADNLFQIFIAPIFLGAEIAFALGYRPQLHSAVQERARQLRAAA